MQKIAAHFSVSSATVSRAINDTGYVEDGLKKKIIRYAEKHGRSCKEQDGFPQGGRVQIIFNLVDNHANSTVLQTILAGIRALGGRAVVDVFTNKDEQFELVSSPVRGARAMVVFCPSTATCEAMTRLSEKGLRMIVYNGENIPGCTTVDFDHTMQMRIALEHLINRGHRRILFYGRLGHLGPAALPAVEMRGKLPENNSRYFVKEMQRICRKAPAHFDLGIDGVSDNYGDSSAFDLALRDGGYSAIVCQGRKLLATTYDAIERSGMTVGKDRSVICLGYTGSLLGFLPQPVVVDSNAQQLGKVILEVLNSEKIKTSSQKYAEPYLVMGQSVTDLSVTGTRNAV